MIHHPLQILLLAVALLVSVPIGVLLLECLASLLRRRPGGTPEGGAAPASRRAVLIPAHNEEEAIARTVESIRPQLSAQDRLLVIADNCTDQTAQRARDAGATVFERHDPERRGKVAALACGLGILAQEPADLLILVDADTPVDPGSISALSRSASETGRPMQAIYLLKPPEGAGMKSRLSSLAFSLKNYVRPRGLARLGLPCPLVGTGMAIPWALLAQARFSEHSIVEDLQLGIDLAILGYPATLCEDAVVTGFLPTTDAAAKIQRRRWEHGHLRTLLTQAPRLVGWALRKGRPALLGMAFDLAVPPLSLLGMLWLFVAALALTSALRGGSPLPLWVSGASGVLFGAGLLTAWAGHLRKQVGLLTLLCLPFYVLWKVPLYVGFLFLRETKWIRTPREGDRRNSGPAPPPA
ncbi:MAG TPA: glycosyltransferase family 2 protein [Planctomycetota bacterium]|nr:glycosyltransferase family 2 protein [Planctomycetota bacterium]